MIFDIVILGHSWTNRTTEKDQYKSCKKYFHRSGEKGGVKQVESKGFFQVSHDKEYLHAGMMNSIRQAEAVLESNGPTRRPVATFCTARKMIGKIFFENIPLFHDLWNGGTNMRTRSRQTRVTVLNYRLPHRPPGGYSRVFFAL